MLQSSKLDLASSTQLPPTPTTTTTTTTSKSSLNGAFPNFPAVGQSDPAGIDWQPAATEVLPSHFGGFKITVLSLTPSSFYPVPTFHGGATNDLPTESPVALVPQTVLIPDFIGQKSQSSEPITTPLSSSSTYLQSPTQSCPNCGKAPTFQDAQSSLLSEFAHRIYQSLLPLSSTSVRLLVAANHHSTIPTAEIPSITRPPVAEPSLHIPPATKVQLSMLSVTFQSNEASLSSSVQPQVADGQVTDQSPPTMTEASSVDMLGSAGVLPTNYLPSVLESINHTASTAFGGSGLISLTAVTLSTTLQTSSPSSPDNPGVLDLSELAFFPHSH